MNKKKTSPESRRELDAITNVQLTTLIRDADIAMYQAKQAGKYQHRLYESHTSQAPMKDQPV